MNRACKVYGTCSKNMMQGPISGMQQGNLDDATRTIYEVRGKGKWVYKEAYEVLNCHQCWKILQDQHPDTLARNVQMKQTSGSRLRLDRIEKKKEEYIAEKDKKKEEYISEIDKKKQERETRIMELKERKTKAVVNLEAQFQAQNDQKVMAMDKSTLDDTQKIYWEAQRNVVMTRMF
ncbi:hypothetical protein GIB67_022607 [Kingdonia uniflora]|uniref:No apical meristem-associated C-terminal domain-containing protein n=1 Tax=Kingdonia uniflora TaxID=39325 RepID=A0A7J7P836_9MAGN|nr:hypothetical protein GIB67_022607 [Kingdonia uniflora]